MARRVMLLRGTKSRLQRAGSRCPPLRAGARRGGFGEVRTYVQSGNDACSRRAGASPTWLTTSREAAAPAVRARRTGEDGRRDTADEARRGGGPQPLWRGGGGQPQAFQVTFRGDAVRPDVIAALQDRAASTEKRSPRSAREIHSWHPDGVARSKLALAITPKNSAATAATGRRSRTLLEMAIDGEAEPDHPYEIVDVFTDTPLHGNPLAVFTGRRRAVPSRLRCRQPPASCTCGRLIFVLSSRRQEGRRHHPDLHPRRRAAPFAGSQPGARHGLRRQSRQPLQEALATVRLRTGVRIVPVKALRVATNRVPGEMDSADPTVSTSTEHPDELLSAARSSRRPRRCRSRGAASTGQRTLIVALHDSRAEVEALRGPRRAGAGAGSGEAS